MLSVLLEEHERLLHLLRQRGEVVARDPHGLHVEVRGARELGGALGAETEVRLLAAEEHPHGTLEAVRVGERRAQLELARIRRVEGDLLGGDAEAAVDHLIRRARERRRRAPELARPFRSPLYPLAPLAYLATATLVVGGVLYTADWRVKGTGLAVLAAGVLVYRPWRALVERTAVKS